MTHCLDTTAVSLLMRSEPGHVRRLLSLHPDEVAIPQPVVAELEYGLARLAPSRRRRELEGRLATILASVPRLPWDDEVSRTFGTTTAVLERRGTRIDDFDVAIAAHALARGATLVTENSRHFQRIPGLVVESWSERAR